ncbi:MAG: hypothetical protein DHS20C12_10120 [Pseudohongiella sp.]|nr:MAG: hypothetical protein DHS20C12_10120 [Pseudohongiella sp.]
MNEKHHAIAIYAEIVSSIAVMITLVVLVFEVRNNTSIAKLEAYKGDLDRVMQWRENSINSDPLRANLWNDYTEGIIPNIEEKPIERLTLLATIFNQFNMFESAYYSNEYGVSGEAEWERMSRVMCNEFQLVLQSGFPVEVILARVSLSYANFLETECT